MSQTYATNRLQGGGGGGGSATWGSITGASPQAAPSGGWTGQTLLPDGTSGSPALVIGNGETFPAGFYWIADSLHLKIGSGNLQFLGGANDLVQNASGKLTINGAANLQLSTSVGQVQVPGVDFYMTGGMLLSCHMAGGTDNTYSIGADFAGVGVGNRLKSGFFGTSVVAPLIDAGSVDIPVTDDSPSVNRLSFKIDGDDFTWWAGFSDGTTANDELYLTFLNNDASESYPIDITRGLLTLAAPKTDMNGNGQVSIVSSDTSPLTTNAANIGTLQLGTQYETPTTGSTVSFSGNVAVMIIDPAGTLATLTVELPNNPVDKTVVRFGTSQALTALTVSGVGGDSVSTPPTTLAAGGFAAFSFREANTTWYRIG